MRQLKLIYFLHSVINITLENRILIYLSFFKRKKSLNYILNSMSPVTIVKLLLMKNKAMLLMY